MFWRNDRNFVVVLEVGSSKVAAAVGEVRVDGTLALLGVGESDSINVRKCEITDMEMAQECIKQALVEAELKTDVAIKEIYLTISGVHLQSTNIRVSTVVETDGYEITGYHLAELEEQAKSHPLPAGHAGVLHYAQNFYLDDGSPTEKPIGLSSKTLSANYHLVSGLATRLQTTIQCVHELGIMVKDYALSSYVTAQAVLSKGQKHLGAVVINCGGGVTDYIVYQEGRVLHTGVLGVGGHHMTNDIVLGFRIPWRKAEGLKKKEGAVTLKPEEKNNRIQLAAEAGFEERHIYRESLVAIMQARQKETLEIIRGELEQKSFWADFSGEIYFTGGASRVKGLVELAHEVFPEHPCRLAGPCPFVGDLNYSNRPDLTTVLGLLIYARQLEIEKPPLRGLARVRQTVKSLLAGAGLL